MKNFTQTVTTYIKVENGVVKRIGKSCVYLPEIKKKKTKEEKAL